MATPSPRQPRSWARKFGDALRGCAVAFRHQSSFWVHAVCAVAVVVTGACVELRAWQWCAVLGCISAVFVAEMLNSALEQLAQAVDSHFNPHLRDALDMGSAAVLLAAVGAVAIGAIVFLL
jgi:diacylglycerol kinase